MSQIKQIGTYRGLVVDKGISKTTNGHIQLVAQLVATECYDFETGEWIEDWQQYDEQYGSEITGYLMLFSKDASKEAFQTAKQLQKAWGWDGVSLSELEQLEPGPFQFRVIEDEYDGKKRLKVAWIDSYDAVPGGIIQKLDESELKKLDAQYANALRKLSGGPKPKSVPKAEKPAMPEVPEKSKKPELPPAAKAKYDAAKKRGKEAEAKVAAATKTKKVSKPPAPTKPAMPAPPPADPPAKEAQSVAESLGLPATCNANEAWETCYKRKSDKMTDVQIGEIWVETVEEFGGQDAVESWATVRDIVLEKIT